LVATVVYMQAAGTQKWSNYTLLILVISLQTANYRLL